MSKYAKTTAEKVHRQRDYERVHRWSRLYPGQNADGADFKEAKVGDYIIYSHEKGRATDTPFASVAHKSDPDKILMSVPTDSNGNIPKDLAIIRFNDVSKGSKSKRSTIVDLGRSAKNRAENNAKTDEERLGQYLWYMHPNESDLDNIDTPDATWAPDRKQGVAIAILGAKKGEAETIRRMIDQSFSNKEKRLMGNVVIDVKNSAGQGIAGYHRQAHGDVSFNQIVIDREYIKKTPDKGGPREGNTNYDRVLVHELIHFLRSRDTKRSGVMASIGHESGGDRDLEEAITDAETMARTSDAPWKSKGDGYYRGKDAAENTTSDRQMLVGLRDGKVPKHDSWTVNYRGRRVTQDGESFSDAVKGTTIPASDLEKTFKNKKGKTAINTVDEQFPNLQIAKMKLRGQREAVDTYWELKSKGVRHTPPTSIRPKATRPSRPCIVLRLRLRENCQSIRMGKRCL